MSESNSKFLEEVFNLRGNLDVLHREIFYAHLCNNDTGEMRERFSSLSRRYSELTGQNYIPPKRED